MGYAKIEFRVCETRHCPLFRFGDLFQLSGIAVHMESQGENSFINTSVVHAPPGRGSCKILNGDLARLIIEYERADQIPDCLITCSGCTGSIRLEHHRTARACRHRTHADVGVGSSGGPRPLHRGRRSK